MASVTSPSTASKPSRPSKPRRNSSAPYDFICMDIMMPEMDGQQALRRIRDLELQSGTVSTNGAKIVMTTALDQPREVFAAFYELCDDYLVKPIDTRRLIEILHEHRLISD